MMKAEELIANGLLKWRQLSHVDENMRKLEEGLRLEMGKNPIDADSLSFSAWQFSMFSAAVYSADLYERASDVSLNLRKIDSCVATYIKAQELLMAFTEAKRMNFYAQSFGWLFYSLMWSVWTCDVPSQKTLLNFISKADDLDVLVDDDYGRSMAEPSLVQIFLHVIHVKSKELGIQIRGISNEKRIDTELTDVFQSKNIELITDCVRRHLMSRWEDSAEFFSARECYGYLCDPCIIALPVEIFALYSLHHMTLDAFSTTFPIPVEVNVVNVLAEKNFRKEGAFESQVISILDAAVKIEEQTETGTPTIPSNDIP